MQVQLINFSIDTIDNRRSVVGSCRSGYKNDLMMKQDIRIREFREEDIDPVFNLIHHVVNISYSTVYTAAALQLYREYHSRENILKDAGSGYCVVAENSGEIVGTGTLLEDSIRRVYVNPLYQNSGIGKQIYDALEMQAVRESVPKLGLGASLIAREFWESRGYLVEAKESIPVGDEKLTFYMMSKSILKNDSGG